MSIRKLLLLSLLTYLVMGIFFDEHKSKDAQSKSDEDIKQNKQKLSVIQIQEGGKLILKPTKYNDEELQYFIEQLTKNYAQGRKKILEKNQDKQGKQEKQSEDQKLDTKSDNIQRSSKIQSKQKKQYDKAKEKQQEKEKEHQNKQADDKQKSKKKSLKQQVSQKQKQPLKQKKDIKQQKHNPSRPSKKQLLTKSLTQLKPVNPSALKSHIPLNTNVQAQTKNLAKTNTETKSQIQAISKTIYPQSSALKVAQRGAKISQPSTPILKPSIPAGVLRSSIPQKPSTIIAKVEPKFEKSEKVSKPIKSQSNLKQGGTSIVKPRPLTRSSLLEPSKSVQPAIKKLQPTPLSKTALPVSNWPHQVLPQTV